MNRNDLCPPAEYEGQVEQKDKDEEKGVEPLPQETRTGHEVLDDKKHKKGRLERSIRGRGWRVRIAIR